MRSAKKGLSFPMFFKVVFSGFFAHPLRLALTFLLSVLAFLLVGVSVTLAEYTQERAKIETYAQLTDLFKICGAEGKLREEDLSWNLALDCGGVVYVRSGFLSGMELSCPEDSAESWGNSLRRYQQAHGGHVQGYISSVVYLPTGGGTERSESWLAGGIPRGENEVAFSSCFARALMAAGWYEGGTVREIRSYGDLVGKTFLLSLPEEGERTVTVCGVYDGNDCALQATSSFGACSMYDITDWHGALFVSEDLYAPFLRVYGADALYFAGDHSRETGKKLVSFLEENEAFYSDVFAQTEMYRSEASRLKMWCGAIGGVLAAFSFLLLYQFISILLDDKSQTILILRMLGARKGIAAKVAFTESLSFGGVIGVCSAGLSAVANPLVNTIFAKLFATNMAVAWFSPISFFSVIALAVLASAIAAIFPTVRLSGKSLLEELVKIE